MAEKTLVSFDGVVKIYLSNSTRTPIGHSCVFSLLLVNSNYYVQLDGGGVRRNRLKVSVVVFRVCFFSSVRQCSSFSVTTLLLQPSEILIGTKQLLATREGLGGVTRI